MFKNKWEDKTVAFMLNHPLSKGFETHIEESVRCGTYEGGGFSGIFIQGLGNNNSLYLEIDEDGDVFVGGQGNASPRPSLDWAKASPYSG